MESNNNIGTYCHCWFMAKFSFLFHDEKTDDEHLWYMRSIVTCHKSDTPPSTQFKTKVRVAKKERRKKNTLSKERYVWAS